MSRVTHRRRGQSVAEFALVLPVLVAMLGGIIQFGLLFWAQNTLTQVVRDTGRWEATQQFIPTVLATGAGGNGCSSQTNANALGNEANSIAASSSLLGYTANEFAASTNPPQLQTTDAAVSGYTTTTNAIAVAWVEDYETTTPEGCSPRDNLASYHVTIRINHIVPVFFPGMQYLPGLGTCANGTCSIVLSSTAQFRMEPAPVQVTNP